MKKSKIQLIDAHQLKAKMDTQTDLCLIDVREPEEWQRSRIPGAHHIPKAQILQDIEAKAPDKKTPIYLHCQGGVRSLHAAESLAELGYEYLYSLEGGILDWSLSGYPIIEF